MVILIAFIVGFAAVTAVAFWQWYHARVVTALLTIVFHRAWSLSNRHYQVSQADLMAEFTEELVALRRRK